eukprot:10747295-Lingulodinium_polyedra.AAC.1
MLRPFGTRPGRARPSCLGQDYFGRIRRAVLPGRAGGAPQARPLGPGQGHDPRLGRRRPWR